jgi:hypothetical protein
MNDNDHMQVQVRVGLPKISINVSPYLHLSRFEQLPDDIFLHIFSYLPAVDVARSAAVSRDVRLRASHPYLWSKLFIQDFDILPADVAVLQLNPRRCYIQRLHQRERKLLLIGERRERERTQAAAASAQLSLGLCLGTLNTCAWLTLPFPLLLTFVALLAYKLDHPELSNISWGGVFSPIFILIALFLITAWIALVLFRIRRHATATSTSIHPHSVWHGQWERLSVAPPVLAIQTVFEERPYAVAHGCSVFFFLAITPLLIACKVFTLSMNNNNEQEDVSNSSTVFFPWSVALLPFWIASILLPFALYTRSMITTDGEVRVVFITFLFILVLPFVISMAALSAGLDIAAANGAPSGVAFPLTQIFAPLWAINALLAFVLLIQGFFSIYRLTAHRSVEEIAFLGFALLLTAVFIAPLFLTLLLISLRVTFYTLPFGHLPWARVLAPLMFWLSVMTLIAIVLSISALVTNVIRPLADVRRRATDPFGSEEGLQIVLEGRVQPPPAAS